MPDTFRSRNHLALAFLVVGKLLGIGGLVVGSAHRLLGGMFLGLDGLFIAIAVGLCLRTMKQRDQQDDGHKQILRQMMKEGTLKQYLRDLQLEAGAAPKTAGEDKVETGAHTAFS